MPTKGYRKGTSDSKIAMNAYARTRLPNDQLAKLDNEADCRSMTRSKLILAIITAHLKHQRAELPQPRGLSNAALRELCRLGNNLNQLARQANTGLVAVNEATLLDCLTEVINAVRRLG